jgi:cysteinyl-tRNA synthetase
MLKLYDTLTRSVQPFEPKDPSSVGLYACGPTVYDYPHIGNMRFNVWVDILRRTLEWAGYPVRLVMNITDIDDKTIAGAQRTGQSLREYTDVYAQAFFEDLATLRVKPATLYPRATEHIEEMADLVQRLIDRGHAYEQDGSIYFRVASFADYGRLSHLDPSQLRSTGRVEGDDYEKEDVRDFALWKAAKEGEPSWETEFGRGRPGWHLECSTMSMKYLGTDFDIHVGGVDLMFPHHENEIAQSTAATGEPFARIWMHCAHLIVDGIKMSKSLGNQYTLRQLMDDGHDPIALRFLLSSVHYRKQLNFTFDAVQQAQASVGRLVELVLRLEQEMPSLPPGDEAPGTFAESLATATEGFRDALLDDLNTSGALGHLFTLVREAHTALDRGSMSRQEAGEVLQWVREVDGIWAVLPGPDQQIERSIEIEGRTLLAVGPPLAEDLVDMIEARIRARAARDFEAADRIRDQLQEHGVELEDTPQGVRWRQRTAAS